MKQVPSAIVLLPALPVLMIVFGVLLIALAPKNTPSVEPTSEAETTISDEVAIVLTVNAAPARPARVAAASGPSEAFVALGVDPMRVSAGETGFGSLCAACHGFDARGMPNLGKDLVGTEFITSVSNDELLAFVKTGRPIWDSANTTGVDMPPRGGNPALSDDQIVDIIYYLRSLDPNYVPSDADVAALAAEASTPEPVAVQPTSASATSATQVAAASTQAPPARASDAGPQDGATLFFGTCSACHGPDGRGLPNLGKDLVTSEFVASTADEELLTFIKTGRPLWDAANTTGIDMPPKGGNPTLSDDDILSIIAYLRTIAE